MSFGGGVRRFLASAASTATSSSPPPADPTPLKGGPSWPPPALVTAIPASPTLPSPKTAPLFLKKDKQEDSGTVKSPVRTQKPLASARSPVASSSSPTPSLSRLPQPSSPLSRVPPPTRVSTSRLGNNAPLNTRDELLISLLASEAVVDSRDFEILSSEEVEDLKKEQQVLMSRQGAMTKKLSLETKIRDAAVSLSRVNAAHKKVSKQSEEQLEAANKRVDVAERELARVSARAADIQKRLLEHRAGVLSYSVRSMERKMAPPEGNTDSGYNTPSGTQRSPTGSSVMSASQKPAAARFEGAHFFAGHSDSVVPGGPKEAASSASALELEEKLTRATEALAASSAKQAELARELAAARKETEEVEAARAEELRSAEDTIAALERELPRLEGMDEEMQTLAREKAVWAEERAAMVREREAERAAWDRDKTQAEDERMEDLARLQEETERMRAEDAQALQRLQEDLEDGVSALRAVVKTHGIPLYSRNESLPTLVAALGSHLQGLAAKVQAHTTAQGEWELLRRKLEDDIRGGMDKRESLSREIEEARREREEARKEIRAMELRVKTDLRSPSLSPNPTPTQMEFSGDVGRVAAILQPLWAILPSPEARAAKFGSARSFRAGSAGSNSPTQPSSPNPSSLSDLDVRSLKALYDSRSPSSPVPGSGVPFSVEAFATRVQALIQDDRALIERLLRFAQAHDLLKKNAERAQKLAAEGSGALETYQKQVRTLEERNMELASKMSALQSEVATLQSAVERVSAEKRDVETRAAEQAATCTQLTEANNALSAKTLALAEEAASAPEAVRKQLEGQLAEVRSALDDARAEVDAMRMSEQGQLNSMLDELNSMQTENGKLRDQLRALKK
ncbi:Up-regulated during septation-domain-containing protein [Mycena rebaudengoi]|nr:Up-regulated during septation-domain-containing protein [Mycena rebaudengoi]